ncbi:MAG TPA: MarR family transcriptional regulator [Thermoleophilaceae bacterium]|jgi:DNA-binding MarR family transcriptional regulator
MAHLKQQPTAPAVPAGGAVAEQRSRGPAAEAWGLIADLFGSQRRRFQAIAQEFELAPQQMGALKHLAEPMPMSDLAGALLCDSSNVTGIVDRLEGRGLVERRADPSDRRVKLLVLTEEGQRVRGELVKRMSEPPPQIASLPAADQRTLRDILRRAAGT